MRLDRCHGPDYCGSRSVKFMLLRATVTKTMSFPAALAAGGIWTQLLVETPGCCCTGGSWRWRTKHQWRWWQWIRRRRWRCCCCSWNRRRCWINSRDGRLSDERCLFHGQRRGNRFLPESRYFANLSNAKQKYLNEDQRHSGKEYY